MNSQIALKIDVEGSEQEIFGDKNLEWLDGISCIAIELHDKARKNCSRNFFSAVESRALEPPKKVGDTVLLTSTDSSAVRRLLNSKAKGDSLLRHLLKEQNALHVLPS